MHSRSHSVFKQIIVTSILILSCNAIAAEDMSREAIEARIQPVGQVRTETVVPAAVSDGKPVVVAARSGESIYTEKCSVCHAMGVAGAPKFGDKGAWAPRKAKGEAILVKHAISGINAMPPRGTCMDCSDDEIKATVKYMLSKS